MNWANRSRNEKVAIVFVTIWLVVGLCILLFTSTEPETEAEAIGQSLFLATAFAALTGALTLVSLPLIVLGGKAFTTNFRRVCDRLLPLCIAWLPAIGMLILSLTY